MTPDKMAAVRRRMAEAPAGKCYTTISVQDLLDLLDAAESVPRLRRALEAAKAGLQQVVDMPSKTGTYLGGNSPVGSARVRTAHQFKAVEVLKAIADAEREGGRC